ncbi:MAG: molybdopterin-guanine dinucleotide biosynthesis protein B [Methanobacterium sp. PtaB.Bin024]|jgi:molybdopterin-guanine dinucleotide biosynthesis protein B|nr:MAG: molybdopterin-guanine dinucleotide biosynthesis protein B [Methanobacterium sp. PtaB.Bin024]
MKILTVTGTKNTGKTTLVTMIVKELTNRGYNVGTIKHTHHDFDLEGKDTWKHRQAGAQIVVGSGESTFFIINEQLPLETILKIMGNTQELDYVVIEGFKFSNYPKISTTPAKDDFTITNVNVFKVKPEEIVSLVDLVEERTYGVIPGSDCGECGFENCLEMSKAIVQGKALEKSCKMRKLKEVELYIGDKKIPLNPFVQDFIKKSVMGMISTLKTDEIDDNEGDLPPEKIELWIRNFED